MQILEGDLLRKMNSSRTKREIKGRKKERGQEEKRTESRKKEKKEREIKGRKKEREQEEICPEMSSLCKHPKPSPCIK